MKTYVATADNRQRDWVLFDADGAILGRLATQIADALRGKHKPEYTPHCDTGDFVVVINAAKIRVTGNKLQDKRYYRHSGYPGGLRSRTLAEMLERRPEEVIRKAVKAMLPRNRLARHQTSPPRRRSPLPRRSRLRRRSPPPRTLPQRNPLLRRKLLRPRSLPLKVGTLGLATKLRKSRPSLPPRLSRNPPEPDAKRRIP